MADSVPTTPTHAPAPPAPAPAPATAAPPAATPPASVEPVKEATTAPQPAPPVVEAPKPAEPAPKETAASVPTLLEEFGKIEPPKPAEAATAATGATAAAAPAATGATAAAAPAPAATGATAAAVPPKPAEPPPLAAVEYKYTVPETMKMDDALKGKVHKAFDDFRANPTEGAQALVNLHEEQMKAYSQWLLDEQQRVFLETRKDWSKRIRSDAELGGSGYNTTGAAVARMRDLFVPPERRAAFDDMLRITGVGDHPEFWRMLHQAARYYDEGPPLETNPRPPPNNGQRPSRRLRDIYDHPRSSAEGRS